MGENLYKYLDSEIGFLGQSTSQARLATAARLGQISGKDNVSNLLLRRYVRHKNATQTSKWAERQVNSRTPGA